MPARPSGLKRRSVIAASVFTVLALSMLFVGAGPAQAMVPPGDTSVVPAALPPLGQGLPPGVGSPANGVALAVPVKPVVTSAARVLAEAAALRGRPYVYGASGPSSFDCSGYTRYVFAHSVGRSLVHSSASQYAGSTKIAKSAIQPGDLVFYTSGGRVYHVGIYAGGGLIWDAPHTGETVRLEKIATSSWVAGRVL
jgi:cell wall-associated NlpC family hydrolase